MTLKGLGNGAWEVIRGVIWNEDPACLLFKNEKDSNKSFGTGGDWLFQFEKGDASSLTQPSHLGNLQFLHAMACAPSETPHVTKQNILMWMSEMYKTFSNQYKLDTKLRDTKLGILFGPGTMTFADLLKGTTPDYAANIQGRALGTCLHLIQDSYARGHT